MGQPNQHDLDSQLAEHLVSLRRLATRLTGNLESSEEIMQETLLRIVRSWDGFQGHSSFRTWAIRILLNVFRTWLSRQRELAPLVDVPDTRQADPAACAMALELGRIVAQRVSSLPPRQREVLILLVYEGLSPDDVSQLLEMQLANVYATLYQARQRLRAELAPFLEASADDIRPCRQS
jgi:RNA polymerase sigma-70 factor (ECF subfamily)